jgi:hypothetical protein
MWDRNEALVQEDVDDGLKMPLGLDDDDSRRVMDAMGDEAAEEFTESGTGGSATAEPSSAADHGGFPERD